MSERNSLVKKRGYIKARSTHFEKFIANLEARFPNLIITDQVALLELEQRLETFHQNLNSFIEIQEQIQDLCDDMEIELNEHETFEASFFAISARAKLLFANSTRQPVEDNKSVHSVNLYTPNATPIQNIKLPIIQLKTFNGNYDQWLEFRDTYNSLIHNNSSINDIQKFHYLRSSLEGSASQIIQSLEFSAENYHIAWDLICSRFNNSRILINNHVQSLFNLQSIARESSSSLRKIIDDVTKHLRALHTLEEPIESWDTLIIHLVVTKLDSTTTREWEEAKSVFERPTFENLKNFLKHRADFLESLETIKRNNKTEISCKTFKGKSDAKFPNNNETKSFVASRAFCSYCKKDHYIYNCSDFLKLDISQRHEQAKKRRLCLNCLRAGHSVKECYSGGCKTCSRHHNSLLHFDTTKNSSSEQQSHPENKPSTSTCPEVSTNLSSRSNCEQVLLSTALVTIFDKNNKSHQARVLLDPGSQSSFITESLAAILDLPKSEVDIKINGLNQAQSTVKFKTSTSIKLKVNNFRFQLCCLIVPQITSDLPNFVVDVKSLNLPARCTLGDPTFYKPSKIDLLIGADYFWQLMCVGQVSLSDKALVLQKSKLGWIMAGPISARNVLSLQCNFSTNNSNEIDNELKRFWEIEEHTEVKVLLREEQKCESHFQQTTRRDTDGRFIVSIPFKDSTDKLGDSYDTARKRLLSLESKLAKNDSFKTRYNDFMKEYVNLGHMQKISGDSKMGYFMPHHGVIKESSQTTKLRVVFDASAPTSTGFSLNNIEMVGPTIQQDLVSILIRHRKHNIVIAGDIEKMYRMVLLEPNQRHFQRILWREDSSHNIDIYELNTVTYGTASASFLAIRSLYQLGIECTEDAPLIAKAIKTDFYVDDFLSGGRTIEDVCALASGVSNELQKGCFKLCKWSSNSPEVLQNINAKNTKKVVDFGLHENTKTLGLLWNSTFDNLSYQISLEFNHTVTKRTILSETSQIFDPLGLLSPCIIIAKIILQNLWNEKLGWDESVPLYIHTKWLNFRNQLLCLNNIRIARQITCKDPVTIELHGFSDASQHAYGACVYARSIDSEGNVFNHLICSKSKVAPIKTLTIPRLELCAAVLLAKLVNKVKTSLSTDITRCVYWTDSTIVLGWINTQSNLLQTFVANRVANIQDLTEPSNWRHVPTQDNPADHISRGVNPNLLQSLSIYWNGPSWLATNEDDWPKLEALSNNDLPELKVNIITQTLTIQTPFLNMSDYSDLNKLNRVIGYCLRFVANCRCKIKVSRQIGPLTAVEIQNSLLVLSKWSQHLFYGDEIRMLSKNKELNANNRLLKLNPFLDENKLIRVGGRISNSDFDFGKKYPIVLSPKCHFTRLLFIAEHKRLLHAGPQLLLAHIRNRFWPVSGGELAKKIVHECVTCFRAKPKFIAPIMGNIPESRLVPAPPFHTTGVDYAGPFLIKDRKGRGCKIHKCYISLFVCFLTRAVHLELVSDLTKDAFLAALRRFVSRRGKPFQIYSDNGTNFVGANNELKNLATFLQNNDLDLRQSLENEGILWRFIPAQSPHFGGLWEAGVKSTKYHLTRVAGNALLTFEELYTLLVQIEAVLNSRPMSPLSTDPTDFTPLTPSHFLIGRTITAVPDSDLTEIKENRLSHFQRIQKLQQHFWCRWSKEYISQLQERSKWRSSHGKLKVNDLVIVKDDNLPPIRTSSGLIKRSFPKICPLPLESDSGK